MKKILIYTNFDKESGHTIHYAAQMATKENLGIEILHVINTAHYGPEFMATADDFTGGPYISTAVNQNTQLAKHRFKEIHDELQLKYPQLPEIRTLLKTGIDTKVVIEETSRKDFFLLAFPGYGNGEFFDFITDIRPVVISEAKCPVLIIPEKAEFKPFKTIIYATDFEQEDIDALKKLAEIAGPFNADIIAVHVTENNDFNEKIREEGFVELIRKKIAYDHITFYAINNDDVEKSVIQFSEERQADLVAVLRENKNFLVKIFRKSIAKSVAKDSKIPVLIFHKY